MQTTQRCNGEMREEDQFNNHDSGGVVPPHQQVNITVLMMTHILHDLPSALHHAWACSAGSKGYLAVKEMLQNGIPGHTLLIESGDLRNVASESDDSTAALEEDVGDDSCCLVYSFSTNYLMAFRYYEHVPSTVKHITAFTNMTGMIRCFLTRCAFVTFVDLGAFSRVAGTPGEEAAMDLCYI